MHEGNMTEDMEKVFKSLYKQLDEIQRETINGLSKEDLGHIHDFHTNNWIDLWKCISSNYGDESKNSILFFYYSTLFKELYWMHRLFLYGNYLDIYRKLRYVLELVMQGHYLDTHYPDLLLDKQLRRGQELEKKLYGWKLIEKQLRKMTENERLVVEFHETWKSLCKQVHPSPRFLDYIAETDFSSFFTDSFNKDLALRLLHIIDQTFDIIYLAMISRFPRAKNELIDRRFEKDWRQFSPITYQSVIGN